MPEYFLINSLLLLSSSVFCGLLFVFSLSQTDKTRQHLPLIIFLGFLSIWYILLTIGLLPSGLDFVPKEFKKPPVFGLARPGLLFVFAGIAHCYINAIRQRNENISRFLSPKALYFYCFIAMVKIRWTLPDRLNNPKVASIVALATLLVILLAILNCYIKLNNLGIVATQKSTTFSQFSWPISCGVSVTLIFLAFYHTFQGSTTLSLYDGYALISTLPLIFWLIYYHTPYIFFDVLAKRGAQIIVFAIVAGLYYGFLAYVIKPTNQTSITTYFLLGIIFSLPTGLFTLTQNFIDRFVDTHLLGRVPFPDLLIKLNLELNKATTPEEAITIVSHNIKQALKAKNVNYIPNHNLSNLNTNTVNIPITNHLEILGYVLIEPSREHSRYLSEDMKFIQLVATNLATTLSRLHLQLEQQNHKVRELELINTASQLRLKALQAQLDPHFLFNSMSLIGNLVRSEPDKARNAVQYLSRVYRYVLDSSRKDLVSAMDEINFLRAYLDIEQLRFESRLKVKFELYKDLDKVFIPPMLLQPLVENAVKHGISPKIEGGELLIKISETPLGLEFIIADTGEGFDPNKTPKSNGDGNGVGLSNVKQQLLMRYQTELIINSSSRGTEIKFYLPNSEVQSKQGVKTHESFNSR